MKNQVSRILYVGIFLFMCSTCHAWGFGQSLFSSKDHAKSIETKGWVVTETQMREAIWEQRDPLQLTYGELTHKRCYFLVRLRNLQGYRAWGTLEVSSPGNFSTIFRVRDVAPYLNENEYFVIPLGVAIFPHSEYEDRPSVCFKWKKLYVK